MSQDNAFDERLDERLHERLDERQFDTSASNLTMANSRFYLDERKTKAGCPCVLKIGIAHKGMSAFISLDVKIFPNQWDAKKMRVVNHSDQMLMNVYIAGVKQQVDTIILSLANEGKLGSMGTAALKNYISDQLNPEKAEAKEDEKRKANLFATRFKKFADNKSGSTKRLYMETYKRLYEYAGERLEEMTFEEVRKEFILSFDAYMEPQSPSRNARKSTCVTFAPCSTKRLMMRLLRHTRFAVYR